MSELEDLGRYHQLADAVRARIKTRNDYLHRASIVLAAAAGSPHNIGAVARGCNFDAVERLLGQAKVEHGAVTDMLNDISALAPVVNKPALKLD